MKRAGMTRVRDTRREKVKALTSRAMQRNIAGYWPVQRLESIEREKDLTKCPW